MSKIRSVWHLEIRCKARGRRKAGPWMTTGTDWACTREEAERKYADELRGYSYSFFEYRITRYDASDR